jgi:tRNA pseudouridine38-40 synthase
VSLGFAMAGSPVPGVVRTMDEQEAGLAEAGQALPAMRTWHLRIAYDGTDFHGWQVQPGQRTVQEELQQRLRHLFRAPELHLSATSRTDAGVHALDQHVSFAAPDLPGLDGESLRHLLNRWLPSDVQVLAAAAAPPGFDARFANCGKAYTYCLFHGEKVAPLFARFVWPLHQRLELGAMQETAALMLGERDFASFGVNPRRDIDSTVCRLLRVQVIPAGDLVCVNVVGNRFLYRMVRSLVGYLVHVGQRRAVPQAVLGVLAARDRCAAAQSAPSAGLFLARVFFGTEEMESYRPQVPPFAWQDGPDGLTAPQSALGDACGARGCGAGPGSGCR